MKQPQCLTSSCRLSLPESAFLDVVRGSGEVPLDDIRETREKSQVIHCDLVLVHLNHEIAVSGDLTSSCDGISHVMVSFRLGNFETRIFSDSFPLLPRPLASKARLSLRLMRRSDEEELDDEEEDGEEPDGLLLCFLLLIFFSEAQNRGASETLTSSCPSCASPSSSSSATLVVIRLVVIIRRSARR